MAPTAVLFLSHDHTTTTMTSTNTIHPNNNITNLGGGSGGSGSANFGVYQQTSVGLSELSIRTLVPDAISAEPYRKALIAKLFFHQILSLTDSPSVTFNDLLATVAAYFDINTGSAEREAEAAAQSLSRSFTTSPISSGLHFLMHPVTLLRFRIQLIAPRISRILLFALSLTLTLLIVALPKNP